MAVVVGGLGISHTPSMGMEFDRVHRHGQPVDPRWQPWFDGAGPAKQALADLQSWVASGQLKVQEDVIDGLENTPKALIGLLAGENRGKRMVRV